MHRTIVPAIAAGLLLLALSGCANPSFTIDPYDPGQRALTGAVVGAGSGAVLGGAIGGWDGAAIGAAAGGVIGAVTGAATTPSQPQASGYPAYSPPTPQP